MCVWLKKKKKKKTVRWYGTKLRTFSFNISFSKFGLVPTLLWSILVKYMSRCQDLHTTGVTLVEQCALEMVRLVCAFCSFNKYLLSICHVPDTALGPGGIAVK